MKYRSLCLPSLVTVAVLSLSSVAVAEPVSFAPAPLEASDMSVQNPWSGLYEWNGQEMIDLPEAAPDSYRRFVWKDFEIAKDQYDFTKLEARLAEAKEKGQRFSFRLRAMTSEGLQVPDYIEQYGNYSDGLWYPDWNDTNFLGRYRALFQAIGAKYDGDERLGYVEIGVYGKWGEGHSPGPNGATDETKKALVDMVVDAFPSHRHIAMSDDEVMLFHALEKSPKTGWRRDSLGWVHFYKTPEDEFSGDTGRWTLFAERWKTAPIVTEFAPWDDSNPDKARESFFDRALLGVQKFHAAEVSNGNLDVNASELTEAEMEKFAELHWRTGLRPRLVKVEVDTQTGSNKLSASWENLGTAPAYEHYEVIWGLRDPATKESIWNTTSGLDLETLLPTEGTPIVVEDAFTIPTQLAGKTLELTVQIVDPTQYRKPLHLVTQGREAEGVYPIGTLTLVEGPAAGPGLDAADEGGCACRAASTGSGSASAAVIAMAAGLALRVRRRRVD
ncbi:MYXO-CTERM sorting domain-containing protein [Polyangium aurulentum]|uniref:MYXO-CTERM sorting domain-containing protein n=1 Tax=Polyangium aurulentum TaxID=2567896 RepID=UPI0010ADC197|nr:MYXO-CTERM sorting domain-containing protein [Polyangium aurulentum]UQA61264.1 DUF4832 domain-containing protein [Polyangium aurulentum]